VMTFHPHPAIILGKRTPPFYLTSLAERARLLESLGVDVMVTYPFSRETANESADSFITKLLNHLSFKHLIVGYDFALGKARKGNVEYLREIGSRLGYTVDTIAPVELDGETVSSSQVRQALSEGNVRKASQILGRPSTLTGPVQYGDGRGRTIGIPTANLEVWADQVLPAVGVYACLVVANRSTWSAVTNIGYRPTFDQSRPTLRVETHLLDFSDNIYDEEIRISFVDRLRGEQRFSGIEALVAQIQIDINHARNILLKSG